MKRMRWMAAIMAAALEAACGGTPARVPVSAGPGGSGSLAGEWAGEYQSPATGRGGSVVFRLDAGRDTATGDVVMVPRGAPGPVRRAPADGAPGAIALAAQPTALTIRFVRVEGDRVSGQLAPYTDPDCGCAVQTTFEGTVRGGRIEGTFVTRGAPGRAEAAGTWHVERGTP